MAWHDVIRRKRALDFPAMLEMLLRQFASTVVPIAIVAISIGALIFLPDHYAVDPIAVSFRVVHDAAGTLKPTSALATLRGKPLVTRQDTHLSEAPFWFAFDAQPMSATDATDIELPSRHALTVACWNAATLEPFGAGTRSDTTDRVLAVRSGFYVRLGMIRKTVPLICRGTFSGPGRLTVNAWSSLDLHTSSDAFHRSTGLLEGGILTLALFVLVTALINREAVYVLFSAWLIGNLRLAALSIGADTQWLGQTIPADWVSWMRQLTMAVYFILTCAMLRALFAVDLRRVRGSQWTLRSAELAGTLLLVLAVILPYRLFEPVMWVIVSYGIGVLTFLLVRLIVVTRSRVAIWYGGALSVTLLAAFSEVLAAAAGVKWIIGVFNSVTAALLSSMMAAFAIAEQIRAERMIRVEAQAELRKTYDATPIGLFTLDASGRIVRTNPAMRKMLEHRTAGVFNEYWQGNFADGAWQMLQEIVARSAGEEIEIRSMPLEGEEQKWFLVKAATSHQQIEGSLQDVTERVRANERLHFLAENDALTGVLNRRGIEKAVQLAMRGLSAGQPFALAYLDLDRFKLVNDLFGHHAGDEVLRQVADRIGTILGDAHSIGRIGGDEFLIVLRDPDLAKTVEICRDIVDRIGSTPYKVGRRAFQVKGSIGMVKIAERIRMPEAISAADRACREAKKKADHVIVYEPGSQALHERIEELRLIEQFGTGFSTNGLYLEMQPLMSLRAPEDSLDFEVLLRMRDPHGALVPTEKIISAAEENGTISELDKWVLTTSLEWLSTHRHRLTKTRFVCVNLSGASLNDEHFIEDIFETIAKYTHVIELLCIEITEGVALHDLDNTRRFIGRLQSCGAKIALDDFGAGYTSFSYLKDLPADALKIDGAFIRSMNSHPANAAIVEAIVALAHNLGMRSIAEWVEDFATLEALAALGVDYVQGWVVARPQSPAAILAASSAAHFITDARLLNYVRQARWAADLQGEIALLPPSDLH